MKRWRRRSCCRWWLQTAWRPRRQATQGARSSAMSGGSFERQSRAADEPTFHPTLTSLSSKVASTQVRAGGEECEHHKGDDLPREAVHSPRNSPPGGGLRSTCRRPTNLGVSIYLSLFSVPQEWCVAHNGLCVGRDAEHLHLRNGSGLQKGFDPQRTPEMLRQSY